MLRLALLLLWLSALTPVTAADPAPSPSPWVTVDGHPAHPTNLLARRKAGVSAQAAARPLAALGLEEKEEFPLVPGLVLLGELPAQQSGARPAPTAKALVSRLKAAEATGLFDYVEPDFIHFKQAVPTDSRFADGTLWGLRNTGQSGGLAGADIDAVRAWDITTGDPSVIVAVIDTGVRYTHLDLAANMWRNPGEVAGNGLDDDGNGYVDDVFGIDEQNNDGDPFDDDDHGTHCAGTIGAVANNAGGHVGVAWNVRLMALKFLGPDGGTTSDAIPCIQYAVAKGARITSNSWGGGGFSQSLNSAIAAANAAGSIFIAAAAGNGGADGVGDNNDTSANFPSNYDQPNVVSVAALDRSDRLGSFSNFGLATVDLGAPGVSIFSSTRGSDTEYKSFGGTSMATPHVAGVAALVLSRFPGITVAELKQRLLLTAVPVGALAGKSVTGGRVNAYQALTLAADGVLELAARTEPASPLPGGGGVAVRVRVSDLSAVTNATVTARFGASSSVFLLDDGAAPDAVAGDGDYAANVAVPTGVAATTLFLAASVPGKQSASLELDFEVTTPPANDRFANRAAFANGASQVTGSNRFATSEAGERANPSVAGGRSVWWSWTASASGPAAITTSGSDFDTTLAVYRGSALESLVLLGSNDDAPGTRTSAVTFTATAGETYAFQVDGYNGAQGALVVNAPPAGSALPGFPQITQQPAGATVLTGANVTFTVVATGAATLTYQWFQNGGALAGRTAPTLALTNVGVADAGNYYVEVANGVGSVRSANAPLSVENIGLTPANDRFADALALTGLEGRSEGANVGASGETGEPNHAGVSLPLHSVWFAYTAAEAGELTLDTLGSAFDTTLAVYTGSSVGGLMLVAANDDLSTGLLNSQVTFTAAAGVTYRVAVDGYEDDTGAVVLNYRLVPSSEPANDLFAARTVVPPAGGTVIGRNTFATGEAGERNHAYDSDPQASVWWSWAPAVTGAVQVDTVGSDFDTVVHVYRGNSLATLTDVAFDDQEGGSNLSKTYFEAVAGQTYVIAVDGWDAEQGNIALNLTPLPNPVPANDAFANAAVISELPALSYAGDNLRATADAGQPNPGGAAEPFHSVWWRWTAPAAGPVTFDTLGSDFDTTLGVYTGNSPAALTLVAENDDIDITAGLFRSSVTFTAAAGVTYRIVVDGFYVHRGLITLNIGYTPPPPESFGDWAADAGLPPGQAGKADDPFRTGVPNGVAYALDLDPRRPDLGQATRMTTAGAFYRLTFQRRRGVPAAAYVVETRAAGGAWTPSGLTPVVVEPGFERETVAVDLPVADLLLARLRVELSLLP